MFVKEDSIVREIWVNSDTVLFIFAGAAAEFALNKAVDWLYYTNKLPKDPLGRLFSTVKYARTIIYSSEEQAHQSIDFIQKIHASVETSRGMAIPDWAYRDVLFMLIDYSIISYEILERKLTSGEKDEIYDVFYRFGSRMGLKELPENFSRWIPVREDHLKKNLQKSEFTSDLLKQYKKHLGLFRYNLLIGVQKLIVPEIAREMLFKNHFTIFKPIIVVYKISKLLKIDAILKSWLLPADYKKQIREIDVQPETTPKEKPQLE